MNDTNQPQSTTVETSTVPTVPVFDPVAMVRHALFVAGDNQVKTSSRAVGEVFGKHHKDVLRATDNLECSEEFWRRNFAPSNYIDGRGKEQRLIEMTFEGFVFLVTGFTGAKAGAFKEAFIAEFMRMQGMLRGDGAHAQLAAVMQTMQALAAEVVALRHDLAELTQTHQVRLLDSQAELIELLKRHQKPQRRPLKAMTPEAHALIEQLLRECMPGAEIARLVECSQATVSLIKHGRYQHSGHAGVPRREGDKQMPLITEVEMDSPLD